MASKWRNIITVTVFCAGLATVFSINMITADKSFSEQENRMLKGRPSFSMKALVNGEFTKAAEEYITDQFVMRDAWLGIKWYADLAVGKKESNGIYIAEQDTLIPRLEEFDEGRLSANTKAVNRLAENIKQPVYFALIPTAEQVWKEKLPYGAPNTNQEALISEIYGKILPKVEVIDCLSPLFENKDEEIFYRTDHHWSTQGAYYAYEQIMAVMGNVAAAAIEKQHMDGGTDKFLKTVTDDFLGTSQSKSGAVGMKPDFIKIWETAQDSSDVYADKDANGLKPMKMYNMTALDEKDKYKVFFDGNHPEILIKNKYPQNREKLLIIKDSYANSMIPFMVNDFDEIYVLDMRFMKKSVSEYAAEKETDKVLVMYGISNFLTDSNISVLK